MGAPVTDWLKIAEECYNASTNYLDANWRKNVERNIALFQSKHPNGSKYNSPAYKHRSRLFRPKTRSVVRKNEAAAAAAFFSNVDVVTIEPENDGDPAQVASAEVMNELVNYRLTKTVPWFITLLGALQEAQVVGIVASYQYWDYEEKRETSYEPVTDDFGMPMVGADGPVMRSVESYRVIKDKPCIELIPFENLRFDPGANWTDVVGTSPYLIRKVPMYVDSVQQMMQQTDHKTGRPKWKEYSQAEIRQAMVEYDTTRQQREDKRQDPLADNNATLKEFEIVWCHENFVRIGGEERVYWTLGTQHLLTDPVDLGEAYFHGERPIVIGCSVIEAHKAMPDALVSLGAELQKEANETVNSRRDNVSLVLNKRYIVKRNAQVDIDSLLKNVPGAVTMANNPLEDVQEMNWPDVTSSAYQEQDRLNVDFDELTGNFSQGSVMTNRKLNETVGGMGMMKEGAGALTEYLLRTFVETWVEPVLAQLVKLEQAYETDATILALCGEKAQLAQKYGIDQVTDELLNQQLTVRVNVGVGATDPQSKLGRFMFALKTYAEVMQMMPDAEPEAIRKEVFGLLGYKDGSRFFKAMDDPKSQMLQQQMQEMQQAMQEMQQKLQVAELQLADKAQENEIRAFDAETKRITATKEEPGDIEDPRKLDAEMFLAEQERIVELQKAHMEEASAERQRLLELAKSVIESQLNKPAPTDAMGEVQPESITKTLSDVMQAIHGLAEQMASVPRGGPSEMVRDPATGMVTHVIKDGRQHPVLRDDGGRVVGLGEPLDELMEW